MDEDVDRLLGDLRAGTHGLRREVDALMNCMEVPLPAAAQRAGNAIETALLKAVRSGKFGFEELKATALGVLADIAAAAVRGAFGQNGVRITEVFDRLPSPTGFPGRATGGPVAPGRAYMVGERGPELFVPTASGRIETGGAAGGSAREVRIAITINAAAGEAPATLAKSSRQVARAIRAALAE